jgi:hypothetical protein
MSWLPELLAGPGVNFNSGRRGKTAVLSEGAGVQGAAASDRGGHGPNWASEFSINDVSHVFGVPA